MEGLLIPGVQPPPQPPRHQQAQPEQQAQQAQQAPPPPVPPQQPNLNPFLGGDQQQPPPPQQPAAQPPVGPPPPGFNPFFAAPAQPHFAGQWVAPRAVRVTLTDFWPKQAEAWFNFAEGQCHDAGIFESRAIFNACLKALPTSLVEDLGPLLRAAPVLQDPFQQLRAEVVRRHTPCVQELLNAIVFAPELGGRPPSELMRSLLLSLPVGEVPGMLFKHLFVLKLPQDLQESVGRRLVELDPVALGEYADQRWHLRNNGKAPSTSGALVAAVDNLSLESAPADAVAAVVGRQPAAKKKTGRHRGGGANKKDQRKQAGRWFCRFHMQYGPKAHSCADPQYCQWAENGGAGSN